MCVNSTALVTLLWLPSLCSSNVVGAGHTGTLLALYCSNKLDLALQTDRQSGTQLATDQVTIVATQLLSILYKGKEALSRRKHSCETAVHLHSKPARKSKSSKKHPTASLTPPSLVVGLMQLTLTICDCHLALLQPSQALEQVDSLLSQYGLPKNLRELRSYKYHDYDLFLCLSKAQYMLGIARLQQIEATCPELFRKMWSNPTGTAVDKENESAASGITKSTQNAPKMRRTRNSKALSDVNAADSGRTKPKQRKDELFPTEPLEHLLISYQLGLLLGYSQLTRDASRWVSVLLSMEPAGLSSHFLSPHFLSCHFLAESMAVSLSHQASLTLGVKLRWLLSSSKSPNLMIKPKAIISQLFYVWSHVYMPKLVEL